MSRVWRRVPEPRQPEPRRDTAERQRTEDPQPEARRDAARGDAGPVQPNERRRASPLREFDLTYAEVTSGRRASPRADHVEPEPRPPSPAREKEYGRKEQPWIKVQGKKQKQRRSPPAGEGSRSGQFRGELQPRRSPPTKRTSSGGVVEVCGTCRQPGHHKKECRREEVCRTCGTHRHQGGDVPRATGRYTTPGSQVGDAQLSD
ncbi:hypothetical protein J5N97_011804 [Dioscorea zingiberensis]|uniref:CCHC-type domain-containing protein n=1 Tax=Dioscorea zingiberensis TaxID=325984 RepID=A0A9D5D2P3_9LILI|nr:hypothetical protein J5N97_011804 [Dioscorea zingiberensis]